MGKGNFQQNKLQVGDAIQYTWGVFSWIGAMSEQTPENVRRCPFLSLEFEAMKGDSDLTGF
jgi:hypothetical protein